jgi:hypothetical protein
MFGGIRRMWREARGTEVKKQVVDIVDRYFKMPPSYERYEIASAFQALESDLENEYGRTSLLPAERLEEIHKQLMKAARAQHSTARWAADGMALMALYIEAMALPGRDAQESVRLVENWRERVRDGEI